MTVIRVSPDVLEPVKLPTGEPVEATFQRAEERSGTSDRGDWIATRFAYRLTDSRYPEAIGSWVSDFVFHRQGQNAKRLMMHLQAIGAVAEDGPEGPEFNTEAVQGAPVIVILRGRERQDDAGETVIEYTPTRVMARG